MEEDEYLLKKTELINELKFIDIPIGSKHDDNDYTYITNVYIDNTMFYEINSETITGEPIYFKGLSRKFLHLFSYNDTTRQISFSIINDPSLSYYSSVEFLEGYIKKNLNI